MTFRAKGVSTLVLTENFVCSFIFSWQFVKNSSRLTFYTGLRVNLKFLANDYIDNNGFSNMTKTFSTKTAGVYSAVCKEILAAKLFAQALATFCK